MNIAIIAVHRANDKIIGFRLLDIDKGETRDVPYENLLSVIRDGKIQIENANVQGYEVVGTNGKLERYPLLINGVLYGKSPLIILYRLDGGRYRVSNYVGEIVDMNEEDIIKYASTEGVANGKIVEDNKRGRFLSSISGEYRQDELISKKKYGDKLRSKMKLIGARDYTIDDDFNIEVINKDIEVLRLNSGILGIKSHGCRDLKKLKKVVFPDTFEILGVLAFYGCSALEEIELPEGVVVIPHRCFAQCTNLKDVYLPNSLREIGEWAFHGCKKLKRIHYGANPVRETMGSIPRGVRKIKRKDK